MEICGLIRIKEKYITFHEKNIKYECLKLRWFYGYGFRQMHFIVFNLQRNIFQWQGYLFYLERSILKIIAY